MDIEARIGRLEKGLVALETLQAKATALDLGEDEKKLLKEILEHERRQRVVTLWVKERGGALKHFAGWLVAIAGGWLIFKQILAVLVKSGGG